MAILKKRAELERLDIDPEVMQYVATNFNSNIRELEGALNKIFVFAKQKAVIDRLYLSRFIFPFFANHTSFTLNSLPLR